jgi:predicted NBD/HSP70 family sugar kinase
MMIGGIDLGGTKIEACLFDSNYNELIRQRIDTPCESYESLLSGIIQQCQWLQQESGQATLPLGIGIPGLIDRFTGLSTTSNLKATGKPLKADLMARLGYAIAVENDCKCFALSEAHGGAGADYPIVFGLIIGTGVGGGICSNGQLMLHHNGLSGEVGHFALPAHIFSKYNLPLLECGCKRIGCYETLLSGPGLVKLCQHVTGKKLSTREIVLGKNNNDPTLMQVYNIWIALFCELLHTIQSVIDPDCIVLGGGMSKLPNLVNDIQKEFVFHHLPGLKMPHIVTAEFGDSSGVRGAAILSMQ